MTKSGERRVICTMLNVLLPWGFKWDSQHMPWIVFINKEKKYWGLEGQSLLIFTDHFANPVIIHEKKFWLWLIALDPFPPLPPAALVTPSILRRAQQSLPETRTGAPGDRIRCGCWQEAFKEKRTLKTVTLFQVRQILSTTENRGRWCGWEEKGKRGWLGLNLYYCLSLFKKYKQSCHKLKN